MVPGLAAEALISAVRALAHAQLADTAARVNIGGLGSEDAEWRHAVYGPTHDTEGEPQ
jgi:hypothetical protein